MNPRTRRRKLIAAAQDVRTVHTHLEAAEAAWDLMRPGLKAQSFAPSTAHHVVIDEDGEGRTSHADPTGQLGSTPSAVRTAERELDEALERLEHEAARIARIVRRSATAGR